MCQITISIPHDTGSEADTARAIAECYAGSTDIAAADAGRECYEVLAAAATGAGLSYVRETGHGAEWSGSAAEIAAARAVLPGWAYVGATT